MSEEIYNGSQDPEEVFAAISIDDLSDIDGNRKIPPTLPLSSLHSRDPSNLEPKK